MSLQVPFILVWASQTILVALAWKATATGWLLLLWVPIHAVGLLATAALLICVTRLLLPLGLTAGKPPLQGPRPSPIWGCANACACAYCQPDCPECCASPQCGAAAAY